MDVRYWSTLVLVYIPDITCQPSVFFLWFHVDQVPPDGAYLSSHEQDTG